MDKANRARTAETPEEPSRGLNLRRRNLRPALLRGQCCRAMPQEGINQNLYYRWSKEPLEAGKKRLAGDTARAATTDEVKELRREAIHPGAGAGPKGSAVRRLKWYVSRVQNVVRGADGGYPSARRFELNRHLANPSDARYNALRQPTV